MVSELKIFEQLNFSHNVTTCMLKLCPLLVQSEMKVGITVHNFESSPSEDNPCHFDLNTYLFHRRFFKHFFCRVLCKNCVHRLRPSWMEVRVIKTLQKVDHLKLCLILIGALVSGDDFLTFFLIESYIKTMVSSCLSDGGHRPFYQAKRFQRSFSKHVTNTAPS